VVHGSRPQAGPAGVLGDPRSGSGAVAEEAAGDRAPAAVRTAGFAHRNKTYTHAALGCVVDTVKGDGA